MARVNRIRTGRSMSTITGIDEVKDLLKSLQERAPEAYERELRTAGQIIATNAKSNINDVTGTLSSSIDVKNKNSRDKKSVSVIAGGAKAPHAHLVEFGHRLVKKGQVIGDVPAHPFLRKAFEQYRAVLLNNLRSAIDRIISTS